MLELETGAKFFILGPKGSGKTTLLWRLKRRSQPSRSKIILFKSEIRKEDRDKLDRMTDLIVVQDQKKFGFREDYKTVWEWYLLKNIYTILQQEDISKGTSTYHDIRHLLSVKDTKLNTIYDNFHVETIKGKIKLSLGYGPLKSELGAEIVARQQDGNMDFLELVRLIQSASCNIKLKDDVSVRLFIDELEFFMSNNGDGERDRRMVRDLVFSVNSINRTFALSKSNIAIIASIRSEIFNSLRTVGQEVEKIVDAYGVKLNWYHSDVDSHPVLEIFSNKIKYSEIHAQGSYNDEVWNMYFPNTVSQKPIKAYLLDYGLHRPRGVVLRLMAALEVADEDYKFSEQNFLDSEELFGQYMLQEFTDEISAAYNEDELEKILALFKGYKYAFDRLEVETRLQELVNRSRKMSKTLKDVNVEQIIRFLYRIGMIGNQFYLVNEAGKKLSRDLWSFRGDTSPIMEQRFVLHRSIRRALQAI